MRTLNMKTTSKKITSNMKATFLNRLHQPKSNNQTYQTKHIEPNYQALACLFCFWLPTFLITKFPAFLKTKPPFSTFFIFCHRHLFADTNISTFLIAKLSFSVY